jgi:hypothetical protein
MSRRHEMIRMLIDDDLDTIKTNQIQDNDNSYLYSILASGFKGYGNYTEEELVQEMNERDLWVNWFREEA